jgi:hypothetical protein
MSKIKTIWDNILKVIMAIIGVTVAFAWVFTFLNITYALAIWSNRWLITLLQGVI